MQLKFNKGLPCFLDIDDKSVDFRMDQPFIDVMGRSRKVNLDTNCNLGGEKNNVLTCRAVANETGLIIESVAVFSRYIGE